MKIVFGNGSEIELESVKTLLVESCETLILSLKQDPSMEQIERFQKSLGQYLGCKVLVMGPNVSMVKVSTEH